MRFKNLSEIQSKIIKLHTLMSYAIHPKVFYYKLVSVCDFKLFNLSSTKSKSVILSNVVTFDGWVRFDEFGKDSSSGVSEPAVTGTFQMRLDMFWFTFIVSTLLLSLRGSTRNALRDLGVERMVVISLISLSTSEKNENNK